MDLQKKYKRLVELRGRLYDLADEVNMMILMNEIFHNSAERAYEDGDYKNYSKWIDKIRMFGSEMKLLNQELASIRKEMAQLMNSFD